MWLVWEEHAKVVKEEHMSEALQRNSHADIEISRGKWCSTPQMSVIKALFERL